ncbi:MAG: DUF6600 domain-containing protein [Pseudomonadota bacterium]
MPQGIRIANPREIFNHLAALTLAAAALLASAAAWADPPGRVGRIAESTGTVWMFDAEQGEWVAAQRNRPLTTGDRLSVERDARTELQVGSATLRLDGGSELEVSELDDQHVRVHLHHGSLALRLRGDESAREFAVTTAEGRFEPQRAGHYRIDQEDKGSFGASLTGAMRFEASDSALEVNAGQRAEFWNERGVTHYSWSALPGDRFADWVAQQDRQDAREVRSRPYVSPEMTGADDLDRYGDWDSHPEYGTLWLPRRVEPGWAPYRYGHWAFVRPWGWTWVDDSPWGFAPFHYGRWVWWRDRWAWAPGQYVARPVYAPALVAWIGGSNFSVGINFGGPSVGWVPLSPREVYRPYYSVTNIYITNINSPYRRWHRPNDPARTGPIMYTNQGVPGGVTVVSQNVLRERRPIGSAVIAPIDSRTIGRWQTQPLQTAPQGNGRRADTFAPPAPPPTARVVAVPGGAVPAAPGAARRTPWGQVSPAQRANVQPTSPPSARGPQGDRDDNRRSSRPADPRGNRAAPDRVVGTPPSSVPQRDAQELRAREQVDARPDHRRTPPHAAQPARPAQAVQPAQPAQVAPAARPVAPAAAPQPLPAPREERGERRGRGAQDANERDERQAPPGQERRNESRREQQNR